ncbi:phosphoribosylaminoimidazolesuccinocarboxamide synthase [Erysipelothrix larvae]|uniref:Phosphoribosylaminoimidazole-succinocarboxamide synthase n=1 Tax=Erysipelothrix larvae TaxID=1514105 RepID=A0A0X8H0M1_9FIRM|nr:phosphoribosylaminoimidazolesuccinocarboxamide synthase [Erysipelothrix larvae]AMC93878.1 phosphoribosylaminoimidazolesuccinocarboxamide synthase [Erysipelothrix larvae]
MKGSLLYEGKAKQVYATDNPDMIIMHYKDDATAFNGVKKAQINHKGELNNAISTLIYDYLKKQGVQTHHIKTLSAREQLCKKVDIIPLEVIVRNVAAGSFSKRLGIEEGTHLKNSVYEICYKDDELGDPLINEDHALALGICDIETLGYIKLQALSINRFLIKLFESCGIELVDFKLEFGNLSNGSLVLADEISPDSCRLWDLETQERLDKDRFRRDLGKVQEAYEEILKRLSEVSTSW